MRISDNWKIETSELDVTLYHRTINKTGEGADKEHWKAKGFYSTVENAYDAMVDMEIKGTGLKDLETVLDKIKELKQEVARWIK